MFWTILIAIFIIAAALYLKFYPENSAQKVSDLKFSYKRKAYFFTKTEKIFFEVLEPIIKNLNFYIFSKVRLLDIISVPNNVENKTTHKNKIQSKHVDFLICDKEYIKPILVIELDDTSHNQNKRIERDLFVNRAFESAGIPILHIKAQNSYNIEELAEKIKAIIAPSKVEI